MKGVLYNMGKELDLEIKNLLTKHEDIKVPEKISVGIDDTLAKIMYSSKRRSWKKHGIMVATIAIIAIIGLGTAFPALAEEIPLVNKVLGKNSVFNRDDNSSEDNLKGVQNYSIGVEHTVTSSGISVKLKELAYDGAAIYIAYEEKGIAATEERFQNESTLIIEGKKLESGVFIPERIDKDTILIKEVYPLSEKDKLPEKMQFSFKFTKILEQSGSWEFNFNVNKSELSRNIDKKELNKKIMLGQDKAKILSLVQSPAYVTITVEFDNYKPDDYSFVIIDDEGNELQQVDLGKMLENGKKTDVTFFYKRINSSKFSKIMLIQQQTGYFASEKIQDRVYLKGNEQLPKVVSIGKGKFLNITKIDDKQNCIEITLVTNELAMHDYIFHGGINIYNNSVSEKDHNAYSMAKVDALGNNTYKVIVNKGENFVGTGGVNLMFGNYDEVIKEIEEISIN